MKTLQAFCTILLFICILIFISYNVRADYNNIIVDKVVSVYDADSFFITQRNWPEIVGKRIGVRVNGVDSPEIRGKCKQEKEWAKVAKMYTFNALKNARYVELKDVQRGKYFRILATVYIDNINLADSLIAAGLGRAYNGGKRGGWCQ